MKTISRKDFETIGENSSDIVKHVNDIATYPTTVLHTKDDGEIETVNTREICFSEGVDAAAEVVQSVLNTQRGEMQFDVTRGIPYLETIFSHPDRLIQWEVEMREAIESLPFVEAIESFESAIEREDVTHRDTQLKVRYSSRIRTNLGDGDEEVDLKDGRTVHLHPFPVAPVANWKLSKDANSTEFTVTVKPGDCLMLRINCDEGAIISWDTDNAQDFSIVGKIDSIVSHTYEKSGTFRVAVGSGVTRFQVQPNSLVVAVNRFNTVLKDVSSMFKDSTELVEVCEWASQIEDISYCYSGCKKLKGVRQENGKFSLPAYTNAITSCTYAYKDCTSLLTDDNGHSCVPLSRTAATDEMFMPKRIHTDGVFYNCYAGAFQKLREIVYQSWGGDIIDFSDDRYCTDFSCTGNTTFKVIAHLRSAVRVYNKSAGEEIADGDSYVSQTFITTADTPTDNTLRTITVSVSGTKRVRFPIGIVRIVLQSKNSTTRVNSYSNVLVDCSNSLDGVTSLTYACAFPSSVKNATQCYKNCTALATVAGLEGHNFWQNITEMAECFMGCTALTVSGNLSSFPSSVKSVVRVFKDCVKLTGDTPALGGSITDATSCFEGCALIGAGQEKLRWGTSLQRLQSTYMGCTSLGQSAGAVFSIPDISTLNVTNMTDCFNGCVGMTCNLPLPPTNRKVVMKRCYYGCTGLTLDTTKDDYKYDKTLMPAIHRNKTYSLTDGVEVKFGEGSDIVHTDFVAGCSEEVRTSYIQSWGGLREDSNSAAVAAYGDYTELFVGTSNREGVKIQSLEVYIGFDGADKTFIVSGIDEFPRLFKTTANDLHSNTLASYSFDTSQKFGTSATTGVSTAVIRIHNAEAKQTRIFCPYRDVKVNAMLNNRGDSVPDDASIGDYYTSNGITYIYNGSKWIDLYITPSENATPSMPGHYKYDDSEGNSVIKDYGDLAFAIQNVNRYATTITNLDAAFSHAANLGNICDWPPALMTSANCYNSCTKLIGLSGGGVPEWPSTLVTANATYIYCTSLTTSGASRLPDFPDACATAQNCFRGCSGGGFTALPGSWGGVGNAAGCYQDCANLGASNSDPEAELPAWGNVCDANHCYYNCTSLYAIMPSWPTFVNGKDYNFAFCYTNCSSLLPNIAFDIPRTAMPVALGGGKIDAEQNKHYNCVFGCSEGVRAQFLSTWGGNFQYSAFTIVCNYTKKASAYIYFGVSMENNAIGNVTVKNVDGKQVSISDNGTQALYDPDEEYEVVDGTVITEEGKNFIVTHSPQSFNTQSNSLCYSGRIGNFDEPLVLTKTQIIGNIELRNADWFKWGAYKSQPKDGTQTMEKNNKWGMINGRLMPPSGTLYPSSTANPLKNVVVSVEDTLRGSVLVLTDYAFYKFSVLTTVSVPNLLYVGSLCFCGCHKLSSVNITDVQYVGANAFEGCKALTEISLPNLTYLGEKCFKDCKKLVSVTLGAVSNIYKDTFLSCKELRKFVCNNDDGITTIETGAFKSIGKSTKDGSGLCNLEFGNVKIQAKAFEDAYIGHLKIDNSPSLAVQLAEFSLAKMKSSINTENASQIVEFTQIALFQTDDSDNIRPFTSATAQTYNTENNTDVAIDALTFIRKIFASEKKYLTKQISIEKIFVKDANGFTMTVKNATQDKATTIDKNIPEADKSK